jgi:hypothetical protein
MFKKLILKFLLISIIFGSGGFDHGKSAGKGNLDLSLTWNPFNYFKQGQSYLIFGYGITNKLDIHGYLSEAKNNPINYYFGLSYQFFKSNRLDFSTAIGYRSFINNNTQSHLFLPQLLFKYKHKDNFGLGGSAVNVIDKDLKINQGMAIDLFLYLGIYENKKYKIDLTFGGFKPVLWKPEGAKWHPTYSIDIKFKR